MKTIICCYNNRKQLEYFLLLSLGELYGSRVIIKDSFDFSCEVFSENIEVLCITINNENNKYSSCAAAYKDTVERWHKFIGKTLFFVHQDIFFLSTAFIDDAHKLLCKEPDAIYGVAGMPEKGRTVSNLKYQKDKSYITQIRAEENTKVMSLDECCFAMSSELYFKTGFDLRVCDHWHLYAVELCYNARVNWNVESFVLKASEEVCHKYNNEGGLYADNHFLWSLIKMMWKYRKHVRKIYTPCLIVDISLCKGSMRLLKSFLKNVLKK